MDIEQKLPKFSKQKLLRNSEPGSIPVNGPKHYIQAATSDNTRKTYQSAIRHFESWGGVLPTSESMVIQYLKFHAETLNPRTLALRLTALRQWHRLQKFPDPTDGAEVRKTLKGIERLHGQPKRKAKAFPIEDFENLISRLYERQDLKAIRDRALLLVGFFGAFRRSELVRISVSHLCWEPEGLIITLPRSKTDQTGQGKIKAVPYGRGMLCAVDALKQWLDAAGIQDGIIFRGITRWGELKSSSLNPASINIILKKIAHDSGLDYVPDLSSHSLRRSLATNAHRSGASFESIRRQGGWSNDEIVWEYIDEAQRFEDNAVSALLSKIKQQH